MDEKNRIDEILNKYIDDNPSFKKEWNRLKALDSGDTVDFDIPSDQLGDISAKCMSILEDAKEIVNSDTENTSSKTKKRWYEYKLGLGIAAAAVLLIAFFTLTPSGRGIAKSIYDAVVTFFGGDMHVEKQVPESKVPENTDFEQASFNSVEEASEFLDYPLIGIDNDDVVLDYIDVTYDGLIHTTQAEYFTPSGNSFVILVNIETEDVILSEIIDASGGNMFEHLLFNGQTMYCNTTADGYCIGQSYWENISLTAMSDNLSWEQLLLYIDQLRPID